MLTNEFHELQQTSIYRLTNLSGNVENLLMAISFTSSGSVICNCGVNPMYVLKYQQTVPGQQFVNVGYIPCTC